MQIKLDQAVRAFFFSHTKKLDNNNLCLMKGFKMSKEFTIYTLFILLTISMGVVFQFMLAKIRELNTVQKRIIKSLHSIHGDVVDIKDNKNNNGQRKGKKDILKGDLTLEYRGAIADTRATFMLDSD